MTLEDHANLTAQQLALPPGGTMEFLAEELHRTRHHLPQGAHQGEQGGLATARGAREQHHLTGADGEAHPIEHLTAVGSTAEPVLQIPHHQARRCSGR